MTLVRENRVLEVLSVAYKEAFLARLEFVSLPISTGLYYPGQTPKYAHFVTSGMTSIVTYMEDGSGVVIEVHDSRTEQPTLVKALDDDESGRGLTIVDAITEQQWGVIARPSGPKISPRSSATSRAAAARALCRGGSRNMAWASFQRPSAMVASCLPG